MKDMEIQTKEIQLGIDAITESKALIHFYSPPPIPSLPTNFNFTIK